MADAINPELLQQILNINSEEVILPLKVKREDVNKLKAVKLTDQESVKIQAFQDYLFDRDYLKDNTFASLFVYLFNLTYTLHKRIAVDEAEKETQLT